MGLRGPRPGEPVYLPSQAEIREKCEMFQAGWTDREKAIRAGFEPEVFVTTPFITVRELSLEDLT